MSTPQTHGANTANLTYTPEHERGSQTVAGVPTWYLNTPAAGVMEEAVAGSTVAWRTYLLGYGRIVAELSTSGGTTTPYYFVADHLLSTTALSDTGGNRKEYDSYDAWGKRRYPSGTDAPGCSSTHPQSLTSRGFTGQEEMDTWCLVNLNARLYDPSLGRMMSEDPVVADPTSAQSFNGYSYVVNKPLALADPSGLTWVLHCDVHNKCLWDWDGNYGQGGGCDLVCDGYGGLSPGSDVWGGEDLAGFWRGTRVGVGELGQDAVFGAWDWVWVSENPAFGGGNDPIGDTGGGPDAGGGGGGGTKSPQAPNPKKGQCSSSAVSRANQIFSGAGSVAYWSGLGAAAMWAVSAAAGFAGQFEIAVPSGVVAENLSNLSLGAQVVQVGAGAFNAQQTGNSGQFVSSVAGLAAGVATSTVPRSGPLPGATGAAVQQAAGSNNVQPSCS